MVTKIIAPQTQLQVTLKHYDWITIHLNYPF